MDKLAIVMSNYIDVDCDVNTTPRQAYERGFRRAFEKCETVVRSRKIENDQLKSENASLNGAAQGLGELCDWYKAENAKLRERLARYELFECVVGDPAEEFARLRRELHRMQRENAKLRELCADMWRDIPKTESCGWDMSTNTCTGSDECIGECSYWYRMRDLGIEVESC